MQLRPYQKEGVEFLARTRRALLAFDTRLGKSFVSLRAAQVVDAARILILSPAIGRLSWAEEIPKAYENYGTYGGVWIVGPGEAPKPNILSQPASRLFPLIVVLAYDALSTDKHGWADALSRCPLWDVVILDECQYLKSVGSNRTQAVYSKLRHNASHIWLLSGTPTPNHAGEMFPHYLALWPDNPPMSRHEFEDEFCIVENTPWGRRITGSRNQAKLRAKLAPVVLRRRKEDVFADLPRVQHNQVPILAPPTLSGIHQNLSDSELESLLASPLTDNAASVRRALGEDKAPGATAWLVEQLEDDTLGKVVVFAWHRTVLDFLETGLAEFAPVRIDGSTSTSARMSAVRAFQKNPACRVFIGQLKAAGTAICLDAADDAVIVEPSWVPMDNYQAASRIENVGARKAATVSWLTAPDSLDARIMGVLRRKTAQLGAIWD